MESKKIVVYIEWAEDTFGAYSNQFHGCIALADTLQEVIMDYKEALQLHNEDEYEYTL